MNLDIRNRIHDLLKAWFTGEPPDAIDVEDFIDAMAFAIAEQLEIRLVNHGADIEWTTMQINAKSA